MMPYLPAEGSTVTTNLSVHHLISYGSRKIDLLTFQERPSLVLSSERHLAGVCKSLRRSVTPDTETHLRGHEKGEAAINMFV